MANNTAYEIGDLIVLTGTFTVNGADTDPTAVTCQLKTPDGTVSTLSTTKTGTGVYQATYSIVQSGTHWYGFGGTGTAQAYHETFFFVADKEVQ